jgi:hypothetical protein
MLNQSGASPRHSLMSRLVFRTRLAHAAIYLVIYRKNVAVTLRLPTRKVLPFISVEVHPSFVETHPAPVFWAACLCLGDLLA